MRFFTGTSDQTNVRRTSFSFLISFSFRELSFLCNSHVHEQFYNYFYATQVNIQKEHYHEKTFTCLDGWKDKIQVLSIMDIKNIFCDRVCYIKSKVSRRIRSK